MVSLILRQYKDCKQCAGSSGLHATTRSARDLCARFGFDDPDGPVSDGSGSDGSDSDDSLSDDDFHFDDDLAPWAEAPCRS